MNILKKRFLLLAFFLTQLSFSQEGVAVYSDYLSDNYYLIHPSMAGAANCAKVRLTARQQWFGQADAPRLQTLSFNTALGDEGSSAFGAIAFNDRNGYHSQKGAKITYAHHIRFSQGNDDLNMLSFGANVGIIQSVLDETQFEPTFDPIVDGTIKQKYSYFNVDIGMSYHLVDFYTHVTVKNAVETRRKIYTEFEDDNLRKFLWSAGYTFGKEDGLLWEPSFMFQSTQKTKEKSIDVNLKVYKTMEEFGKIWGGLSYRRSFDATQYAEGGAVKDQTLQYITPIVGINYKNFMAAYTYSYLTGAVKFDNSGFHQITLGFNFNCKREPYHCNCPAVN
ncbi:Bacteroidetes-specific putative membrane protein [Flavobacterium saliperosum S13]|uniref:Type IX secretion system membrane protein, PorP/SprF family n=2 Tax=Flavobacterium saliperosum TaxID=329186 RepID=A0A1G4V6Y6_9FLAO|nr:type IX secretion system membrane protein PorP/SprF [Flavobacterium saliperosum]ESU27961.1 Bacteroidetes-specific putative membrane protein [Flavobacterium saliperosum S13]SCX02207.1 type IX secretion system membrane protein, PorP/SprF family [Flavobacterium saliperosum]